MTSRERIARPVRIAQELAAGALGGTYTEAVLLLTALLSAIAAEAWPGTGVDRMRFIELLVRHTPSALEATKISLPLLIRDCHVEGQHDTAKKLEGLRPRLFGPGQDSRVLTGEEVDVFEDDVVAASGLDLRRVRETSYAAVLYKRVRCGVAHQYSLDRDATAWPMASKSAAISYSNLLELDHTREPSEPHDLGRRLGTVRRQIHFGVDWLAELVFATFESTGLNQLPTPATWWAGGTT